MRYLLYLLVSILLCQVQAMAQRQAGSYLVGASLAEISYRSTSITKNDKSRHQSFSLTPMLGRFFTSDIVGGAAITIQQDHGRNMFSSPGRDDAVNNGLTLGLELFGRKYFGSPSASAWPYVQAAIGYQRESDKAKTGLTHTDPNTPANNYTETNTQRSTAPGFKFTGLIGGNYLLNRYVALDFNTGYQFSSMNRKNKNSSVLIEANGTVSAIESETYNKTNKSGPVFAIALNIFLSRLGKEK